MNIGGFICPSIGSTDNAYRIDVGVYCYQLPPDDPDGSNRLDAMEFRHTWCLTQRVRWNDEKFPDRSEDESLLATCNMAYLTRKLSASRKFDIATFFYYSALPENFDKVECSLVKNIMLVGAYHRVSMPWCPGTWWCLWMPLAQEPALIQFLHLGVAWIVPL